MSISTVASSLAAGAIALTALGHTVPAPSVSAVVRPPVALRLALDAEFYRKTLQDVQCTSTCRALETALADTLLPLLQRTYAFLDWSGASSATDTIEIRLVDRPPPQIPGNQLSFSIRSAPNTPPRMAKPSYPVDFESFTDLSDRVTVPQRWHPDSMRRAWAARVTPLLQQPDLLLEVFGRIPISADVKFRAGHATVALRPGDIGASEGVRPAFRARAHVADTVRGSEDDADLTLAGCQPAIGGKGYVCDVVQLQFIAKPPLSSDSMVAVVGRSTAVASSVYVLEYATAERPSRFNGAVLPRQGVP